MIEPVRASRSKLVAGAVAVTLIIATAPWAASHYDEWTAENEFAPAAAREQLVVLPGLAMATRDGQSVRAAVGDDISVQVDFGQLLAGESVSFADVLQVRNDGREPVLLYVEPSGVSEAPMHASVSGDDAPGAYRVEAGATRSIDVALTADLIALPGDVNGALKLRSASGRFEREVPARATVTQPALQTTIDTLLAPVTNPEAGYDKIAETVGGLEAPEFVIDGVTDGGAYATDVTVSWRPVGPLASVSASIDGHPIGQVATVTEEGEHVLVLEGKALGVAPLSKRVAFRIDKTAPEARVVSAPTQLSEPVVLVAEASDLGSVVAVDFVLQNAPAAALLPQVAEVNPEATDGLVPAEVEAVAPTPTPAPEEAGRPQELRVPAGRDEATGLWTVTMKLAPGTYYLWAEAVDAVGNRRNSVAQILTVIAALPEITS